MTESGPDFSRTSRKKGRNRSSRILNILIGIVAVLIIIVASIILSGDKDDKIAGGENTSTDQSGVLDGDENDELVEKPKDDEDVSDVEEKVEKESEDKEEISEEANNQEPGDVTYSSSDDEVVAKTIIKTGWEPIGTTQTGEHVSLYDGTSADWNEKQDALAYATEMSKDNMIFWKIKNGGNPSKSIGIVSSKDKSESYRVYLEWVDGKGWKPVKMDVLNTLEFKY